MVKEVQPRRNVTGLATPWRLRVKTFLFLAFPWVFRRTKAYAYWNRNLLAGRSYAEWIKRRELPLFRDHRAIAADIRGFSSRPTFRLVIPVGDGDWPAAEDSVDSVLRQSYPDWTLQIVVSSADDNRQDCGGAASGLDVQSSSRGSDAVSENSAAPGTGPSQAEHLEKRLEDHSFRDSRIRILFEDEEPETDGDGGTPGMEWLAFLYPGDRLSEHAIYFLAKTIDADPSAKVVYMDEDRIDHRGDRHDPQFKPDWNPDLYFSRDYVSQLVAYRKDLLTNAGLPADVIESRPDPNLLLRCLPFVDAREITHVPWVLYHRRATEEQATEPESPSDIANRQRKEALEDALKASERGIRVETGLLPNSFHVRFPLPDPQPLVTLIVPTRDRLELISACVESVLERTTYANYELLIIDNQSRRKETLSWFESIRENPRIRVLGYDHPFNYAAINNFGVSESRGEIIGLINNDIEVISPDWLDEMVSHACRTDIACVGAKLYYSDDSVQHAGVLLGIRNGAAHAHRLLHRTDSGYCGRLRLVQNMSAVTAACLVVRRSVYDELGGLDEDSLAIDFNDVDFCLRALEAGYRNLWTPYAELYHHESASRGANTSPEDQARHAQEQGYLLSRWGRYVDQDPAYNPNLTRYREDFSLG